MKLSVFTEIKYSEMKFNLTGTTLGNIKSWERILHLDLSQWEMKVEDAFQLG